jgi:hypothetical protein
MIHGEPRARHSKCAENIRQRIELRWIALLCSNRTLSVHLEFSISNVDADGVSHHLHICTRTAIQVTLGICRVLKPKHSHLLAHIQSREHIL